MLTVYFASADIECEKENKYLPTNKKYCFRFSVRQHEKSLNEEMEEKNHEKKTMKKGRILAPVFEASAYSRVNWQRQKLQSENEVEKWMDVRFARRELKS